MQDVDPAHHMALKLLSVLRYQRPGGQPVERQLPAFNDVQGTEVVAGILGNLEHSCRAKRLIRLEVLR